MRKWLYTLGGFLALALGAAGIVLPLLPTTPFLLLASYCFVRSSPAAHRWLLSHPWFGPYLRDWEVRRGVRRSVKVLAIVSVLAVVLATWLLIEKSLAFRLVVTGLASVGLFVVWRLPVVSAEPAETNSTAPTEAAAPLDMVA